MTPRARAILAAVSGLVAAAAFAALVGVKEPLLLLPTAALALAASVALIPRLGAQLLARALWWSNLVLGALLSFLGNHSEQHTGIVMAVACAAALLLADRRVLASAKEARAHRPAAFAGTIELVMVLALADAATLLFFAAVHLNDSVMGHPWRTWIAFLAAAGALVVGFVGLYRLALWGVFVTVGTAALLLVGVLSGAIATDRQLVTPLVLLACAQLAAPAPMFFTILTGRALPAPPPRVRSRLASFAIAGVAAVSVVVGLLRHARFD